MTEERIVTTAGDYRAMRRIRAAEERLMALKSEGRIPGSIHLCIGQEAIPVGACSVLGVNDYVTATYRGHGWALARGAELVSLFAEVMGRDSTLCGGRAGSAYLSDAAHRFLGENSIVGGGVPMAAGAALTAKHNRTGNVSLVSIGDGAMNQGAVHEVLNMASVLRLPLVIVVENNRYSEMSRIADMVRVEQLAERAAAYGMPGCTVDGNDAQEVAAAVGKAVGKARSGGGPSLVEAMTERLVGHHSGDAQQYRPAGEVAEARLREPLARLRERVSGDEAALDELDRIDRQIAEEVEAAVAEAESMSNPEPASVRSHVYA